MEANPFSNSYVKKDLNKINDNDEVDDDEENDDDEDDDEKDDVYNHIAEKEYFILPKPIPIFRNDEIVSYFSHTNKLGPKEEILAYFERNTFELIQLIKNIRKDTALRIYDLLVEHQNDFPDVFKLPAEKELDNIESNKITEFVSYLQSFPQNQQGKIKICNFDTYEDWEEMQADCEKKQKMGCVYFPQFGWAKLPGNSQECLEILTRILLNKQIYTYTDIWYGVVYLYTPRMALYYRKLERLKEIINQFRFNRVNKQKKRHSDYFKKMDTPFEVKYVTRYRNEKKIYRNGREVLHSIKEGRIIVPIFSNFKLDKANMAIYECLTGDVQGKCVFFSTVLIQTDKKHPDRKYRFIDTPGLEQLGPTRFIQNVVNIVCFQKY